MNKEEQDKQMIDTFIRKLNDLSVGIVDLRDQFIRFKAWRAQDSEFKEKSDWR